MDISNTLVLLFGLATTALGILLKGEYDKRAALQKQVSDYKHSAYEAFNEAINEFLAGAKDKDQAKNAERAVKQLMDLRKGIWQYGSDEVVKAYALWNQCVFAAKDDNELSGAAIILMADLIVKMRKDFGLSNSDSLTSLDILQVFINDIEVKYDDLTTTARKFRKKLREAKHTHL